jgi:CRP-like cAMP-binding protein
MSPNQNKPKKMRDQRLIEGVLTGTSLFKAASPAQVAGIARHCWSLQARCGDLVAEHGAPLAGVFALAHGTVKLVLRGPADEERVLRLVSLGDTFGESTALLARPCRYDARALTECKLVVIPPAAIFDLIEADAKCARQVVQALAEHSFELFAEVESSSLRKGPQRLAAYLVSLVERARTSGEKIASWTVRLPASKTVIASRLGMKKETLSRLLRSLSDQGVIRVAQRDITILDYERLAALT